MKYIDRLSKELFEDIVIFSVSEPGAMGPNDMTFYKRNGESFSVDYNSEKTAYSKIKELFPVLKGCYWNGPTKNEMAAARTVVIGGLGTETRVADGWKHIYLGYGNHIAVKKELHNEVKEIFNQNDECEFAFNWAEILNKAGFSAKIPDIEKNYIELIKEYYIWKEQ